MVSQINFGVALSERVSNEAIVHIYGHSQPDDLGTSTNTAETFFSVKKRAIICAWQYFFREDLPRWTRTFDSRWNKCQDPDGRDTEQFIQCFAG